MEGSFLVVMQMFFSRYQMIKFHFDEILAKKAIFWQKFAKMKNEKYIF
jgi:hypothetical protein